MNLILSDVEETIMLVDGVEGAPPGQGVVNVSPSSPFNIAIFVLTCRPRWQKERWKCSLSEEMALFWCEHPSLHRDVRLNPPCYQGVTSFTDMTSIRWTIAFDVVWFHALFDLLYSGM
jgi:hypothetical protein